MGPLLKGKNKKDLVEDLAKNKKEILFRINHANVAELQISDYAN